MVFTRIDGPRKGTKSADRRITIRFPRGFGQAVGANKENTTSQLYVTLTKDRP